MQKSRYKKLKLNKNFPINPTAIDRNPKPAINKLEFLFLRLREKNLAEITRIVPINTTKKLIKITYRIIVEMLRHLQL
jgi:hypothetical protein